MWEDVLAKVPEDQTHYISQYFEHLSAKLSLPIETLKDKAVQAPDRFLAGLAGFCTQRDVPTEEEDPPPTPTDTAVKCPESGEMVSPDYCNGLCEDRNGCPASPMSERSE